MSDDNILLETKKTIERIYREKRLMKSNISALYRLEMIDYSLPSFCSGMTAYYGTEEDIQDFLKCLEVKKDEISEYQTLKKQKESETGFKMVSLLNLTEKFADNYAHEYMNVWDCPYYIHAENLTMSIALVKDGCRYVICGKPSFKAAYYGIEKDAEPYPWEFFNADDLWGHPGVYKADGKDRLTSRLYIPESVFNTKEEALKSFESFDINSCDGMFNDIFGDG